MAIEVLVVHAGFDSSGLLDYVIVSSTLYIGMSGVGLGGM